MEEESKANVSLESGELEPSPEKPLDIPLPLESPTSQSSYLSSPSVQNTSLRKSVLGIDNAKRRLKGFFIAKKAQEAKGTDVGTSTPIFAQKALFRKLKVNDEAETPPEKKKLKKGLSPHEKAKATITEIEELKKNEALRQAMFLTQSRLVKYGFKRQSSRDRRDGSYKHKSRRYRSSSKRSSDNYNHRRETHKNDSKSHSKSRHDYHNRNSYPKLDRNERNSKNHWDNKNDKSLRNERSHEKVDNDSRGSGNKYKSRNKKESSHETKTRHSTERTKTRDCLSSDRSQNISKHVHNDLSHFTLGEDKSIPQSSRNEYSNNLVVDDFTGNSTSKSQVQLPESSDNIQSQLLDLDSLSKMPSSTPAAKINAICPYDTESDSENSASRLENICKDAKKQIPPFDTNFNHNQNQIDIADNNIDDKSACSGYSPSFATVSPKAYTPGCSSEHVIEQVFIRNNVNKNQKKSRKRPQKYPYANFVRHPYILQKSTKTEPLLFYAENPAYSLASRTWYPYYTDCLVESCTPDETSKNLVSTAPTSLAQESHYSIDMGDYDNTKNDISNRELVMNAEPPFIKTHSEISLNTEYEEFMRAVATESHHETKTPKHIGEEELVDKPLKLELIKEYIKNKSSTGCDMADSTSSNAKLFSEHSKSSKSRISKSNKSPSSPSSSESNSSSSDSSSSDSSSSDSSSSDSSSESDSDSSSSITDSPEKEELEDDKICDTKVPVQLQNAKSNSIDSLQKPDKNYGEPTIPMPFIVKVEKDIHLDTSKPYNSIISQIKIKQEPLDISNDNDLDITSELSKQDSEVSQSTIVNVKSNVETSILNYGGETFHIVDWDESPESAKSDENAPNLVIHQNESQNSKGSPKQISPCKLINGNVSRNIGNICDIPLPEITDDISSQHDSVSEHFPTSEEKCTPKKNHQFISFKLSSGSKCKPVSITEDSLDDKSISNVCKQIFVELEDDNSILSDKLHMKCDQPLSGEIRELRKDCNVIPVAAKSTRSRSKSHDENHHMSLPRLDQRPPEKATRRSRSRSPRNHSQNYKSHSSSSRSSHNDRNKYNRHENRKWSPRSHKYGSSKSTSHESGRGSRSSDRGFAQSDRDLRRTVTPDHLAYRNDECLQNDAHTSYRSSSNYRNDNHERNYDDRRNRNRPRSRDRSRDRTTNSSRRDPDDRHYNRHEVYHMDKQKLQTEGLYDIKHNSLPHSPKTLDLDNIPLPKQNDYSDMCAASAITTVIGTVKDYASCGIEVLHPQAIPCMTQSNHDTASIDHCLPQDNQCIIQDNSFESAYYHEPATEVYTERPLEFSPKRISLDARINMVLGIDDSNNSNSCDQEFNLNGYASTSYDNNYVDANQYSIPSVSDMPYPRSESSEVIETIHTYPQTGPSVNKRRAQCANLVNVVLTETPVQKSESKTANVDAKALPNLSPSDILKCVSIVKLGGPLTVLPPDVAKLESRTIFKQIEHYMKDERHQQRFQKQPKSTDALKINEISPSTVNQAHYEDNSNQENLYGNDENQVIKTSESDLANPLATKSILSTRFCTGRQSSSRQKSKQVKFADGVLPGDGTSTSGGEMSTSPLADSGKAKGIGKKLKRKKRKMKTRKNGGAPSLYDGFMELPPPPPPEGEPPSFLLQPYDIANNAALGYTEIPKALERFSVFFNSALSKRAPQVSEDVDDGSDT